MIESDLKRKRKSELQVRPIQPPSAMHAKQVVLARMNLFNSDYCLAKHFIIREQMLDYCLSFPIESGDHGETW